VGLYDFTSAHVLDEVRKSIGSGGRRLSLVLDHPPKNPTADQTDEQTQATLAVALGDRESFAWAAEAHDPMVSSAVFPNAYHIKVAVADHELFWLSSGNWNNSNQPDIDPWTDKQSADEIAKKSDRDWHVILRHSGLAQTFEAFLSHDLEVARQVQAQAPAALLLEREVPAPEPRIEAVSAPHEYFHPLEIKDEMVTIQPLFTPDVGAGNYAENILKLIDSAAERLYIQTQYVHPPRQGIDAGFQALIEAVKGKMDRRLDVKIILSQYEATGGYLEKLQEAGWDMSALRIQDGVHNKGFIVDSKTVALGSQNWSGDGVLRNRDATLIIYHKGAAQYFERIFLHDWNNLAHQKLQTR
jgi:phosphatidylserine/phosphatidylglycerophosphate/cardiolipin synthase-like enzyme